MESDPNKKESKGKRILKKAIRRNSKSSNNSQNSALSQGSGATRSKSFENKRLALEINDSTPLPTPDGTERAEHGHNSPRLNIDEPQQVHKDDDGGMRSKKTVDINEGHNTVYEETPAANSTNAKNISNLSVVDASKRNLKRVG
nr:uncharacterized protein LOC113393132 [Vanessa tameamea]